MNREQKAAVIDEVATEIRDAEALIAVDYRGISVRQASELRVRLEEAGAGFRVVKNTLTERAADQAGTAELKQYLEGPTAFAFVRGDAALAAKALATFRREHRLLEFKGGLLGDQVLSADDIETIARLPARDVLQGQLVGVLAAPVTGLVWGLGGLLSGLAVALGQISEQGLIGADGGEPTASGGGDAESAEGDEDSAPAPADTDAGDEPADAADPPEPAEAPGDPVAEAAAAEEETEGDPAS